MTRQVGTTGSTVWMTDDDPDGPVTTVYPEGEPTKVRLLGSVIAMSNGAFRPTAQTAAVGQTLPGDEYLRRRNLWNDPGSGQFKRRGWSSLKALAARLLDGAGVRDDAREKGSITARLRNERFTNVGLSAGDVVTVRYEDDDFGRIVVTRDTGRTRSYRVPWNQLLPVESDDSPPVAVSPDRDDRMDDVEAGGWTVRSESTPLTRHSPPTRQVVVPTESNPAAARAAALQLLEQVSDDPFDVPDGGDDLTAQDRERLEVIVDAGMVLLGDLRAAQEAGRREALLSYWSDAEVAKRLTKAERAYRKAEDAFVEMQDELVANVVEATTTRSMALPQPPFRVVGPPTNSGAIEFEDSAGDRWSIVPVANSLNRIHGWKLRSDTDASRDYPVAWQSVTRHKYDEVGKELALDRKAATSAANTLRRRRIDLRNAEAEQADLETSRLFADRDTATDTLIDALGTAMPELLAAVEATVERPDTTITGIGHSANEPMSAAEVMETIGRVDPSRNIVIRSSRQRVQIVSVPTVTADGQQQWVQIGLKRSPFRDTVAVDRVKVTGLEEFSELLDVQFRGRTRLKSEDFVSRFYEWVDWSEAQRAIDANTFDTTSSATEGWAVEALDAGVEAAVEPMTSTSKDRAAAKQIAAAARMLPAPLVEALNERSDRQLLAMAGMRGVDFQSSYNEGAYWIKLSTNNAALHEYGHALEYRVPALNRMIWAFYQHRTEGDDLYASQIQMGVATRQDWFFDSYSGRDYGSGTQRNAERLGREVFTTGLDSLFLGKSGSEQLALDDEHAAFVLGALLLASRPGADGVRVRPGNSPLNVGFAKGEEVMGPLADTPDVSIDAAMMQVMEAPDWTDRVDEPVRQRAGRARGQWIETATSRHSAPLPDGNRLVVTVDAEVNRRNVRREAIMATGEQGEGLEVRGGAPSGSASWIVIDSEGQIVLSTDPRDELDLQPDETVEAFRERAKQAALEAAVRAKQNDLPSEADLESMSLSELEALFFSLRDNQTVNRNFLYLLRRHIKAKREGTTIDAIQTGPYTYMNRPVLFAEVDASHTTTTRVVAAYSDFGDDLSFPVGFVTWDRNALTLELVGVQRDARNQGIAQELIRQAMALEPRLRPKDNDARSADGDALVRSMWPDAAPASRQLSETEAESLAAGMFVQLDVSPESRLQSLPVQSIDMLEIGAPVSEPVAGATIDGIRGRDTMSTEIYTRRGDSWKQAVTKISEQISDDAMDEFAAGMAALLVAEDQRRQQRVDNAPASDRLIRGVGQLDLSQTDLSKDSGWSPGDGTIVTTIDPSFTKVGFEKTYKAMIRREDVVPITDDRDGYTTWMAWDDKANLMRVFKVRDDLQQEDGTWKLPSSFTNFGGPVGGANGDDTLGVKRAAAALMRGAWAKSADSVLSYLLREAALEVSGETTRTLRKLVEAKSENPDQLVKFDAGVAQVAFMRSLARDVVQAGYADTQRRLAELGINEVTLYRGVADFGGFPDGRGTVTDAPLSSWTADWTVAQYFADLRKYDGISWGAPLVMVRTVPAEQIMGWAGTALGSEDELEVVLLGSEKADTLVMEDYELDDETMEQILPRRAAVVVDDDAVIVDEDWIRVVRRSRGDAVWSAIFDDGVVAHFTNDSWDVVGPEPARTDVETMLGGYLENGWPYQFGGWTDEAFAAGVDPEWMKFRLLGSGARFVLGPVGALGSLRVSTDDVIVG